MSTHPLDSVFCRAVWAGLEERQQKARLSLDCVCLHACRHVDMWVECVSVCVIHCNTRQRVWEASTVAGGEERSGVSMLSRAEPGGTLAATIKPPSSRCTKTHEMFYDHLPTVLLRNN